MSKPMRRLVRAAVAMLTILTVAAGLAYMNRNWLIDNAIRKQLEAGTEYGFPSAPDRVQVLLCGTGSPEPSAAAQACTLVSAGGKLFVFDLGEGATASLSDADVPIHDVERVFLTHLHSDHFNGLGTFVNQSWIWGRQTPVDVMGPAGTGEVVDALNAAYELDNGFRAQNMSDLADTRAAGKANPMQIAFPDGVRTARVYDRDGVTVDAHLVVHDPVRPAVGYVIGYAGTKVFVSGDTEVSPLNLPAMQDADLVVHEAYATHLVRRSIPIMRDVGMDHDALVAERTIAYHADTIALADQAEQAGVEHLVLTHLTPYPQNVVARMLFTDGMSERYSGQLTVGEDGMVLTL